MKCLQYRCSLLLFVCLESSSKCSALFTCLLLLTVNPSGPCRLLTQEMVLRLAEVGSALTILHVDELLLTAGTASFHPLLRLPSSLLKKERTRISQLSPSLMDQQNQDLDDVIKERQKALKKHQEQHGTGNFVADFKVGTNTIKSLVVSTD